MSQEIDLLRRYVDDHDEVAFAELVHRDLPLVYNAALRGLNGNAHLAEEAAQAVFTQLACNAKSLTRHPVLVGWLYTTTKFTANVIRRREQRRFNNERTAAAIPIDSVTAEWEALRPLLDEALDLLSDRDRHAVVLRFFANRSHAEIGSELHVSDEAARKCVDRALERLRAVLVSRGVTTTAAALAVTISTLPTVAAPAALAGKIASVATTTSAATTTAAGTSSLLTGMTSTVHASTAAVSAFSVAASLLLAAGMVIWSIDQWRERRQLDTLRSEVLAMRARMADFRKNVGLREKDFSARAAIQTTGAAIQSPTVSMMAENLKLWEKLANDPEYAKVRAWEYRIRAQNEFSTFLAMRNYSPAQIALLRTALAAHYDSDERRQVGLQIAGLSRSVDQKELDQAGSEEREKFFAALKPEFSAAEVADIRHVYGAKRELGLAETISWDMELADDRLNKVQQLSLALVLDDADKAEWRPGVTDEGRRQMRSPDAKTGLSPRDRQVLEDAAAFMSPNQVRLYGEFMRNAHLRQSIVDRARTQVAATSRQP